MKYYDESIDKYYTEYELRKMLLVEETNDILNNINDYVEGQIDIKHQSEIINNCVNNDLYWVINQLNDCWGFNIISEVE